jgi:hypothetical protein
MRSRVPSRRALIGAAGLCLVGGSIAGWRFLPPDVVAGEGAALAAGKGAADRLAIKGYDPVAYFTEGRPVEGSSEFEEVWNGARWRFATASHRDLFRADPDRYAPQYAGYCAFGVAQGLKLEIDPNSWTIVDGKLHLNYDRKTRDKWRKDQVANVEKADHVWPTLHD